MPFPQYVASFSKSTFVSGSVSGRILSAVYVVICVAMRSQTVEKFEVARELFLWRSVGSSATAFTELHQNFS